MEEAARRQRDVAWRGRRRARPVDWTVTATGARAGLEISVVARGFDREFRRQPVMAGDDRGTAGNRQETGAFRMI